MKILVVTQYFWPEDFRVNDLASSLVERGHDVTVLTGKPNYPAGRFFDGYGFFGRSEESRAGVRILRVPLFPRGNGGGLRLVLNYLSFAFFGSLLGPRIYREKPDAIVIYQLSPVLIALPALLLKRLRKVPVLMWVQDLWPESLLATGAVRSPRLLNAVGSLVRSIYRKCDLILIQSEAFRESLIKYGADPKSIRYLPNSAEDFYSNRGASIPSETAAIPAGFRILFAGNIGVAQDFANLLDAAERTKHRPDIQWVIVGEGRQLNWVEQERKRRGLERNFHLLGRFPPERMPEFFSFADVLLVSLRDEPIFSLTLPSKVQSYLAAQKPILAALSGEGARIIRKAGAGLVVPPNRPELLAEAATELAEKSAAELETMALQGRRLFEEEFSRMRISSGFEQALEELIALPLKSENMF